MLIKENKNVIFIMDGEEADLELFDNKNIDSWKAKAIKNTIYNKIASTVVTEYLDFMTPPSLFNCAQTDDEGCIPLKVISKSPISNDTYKFELSFPN